MTISVLKEKGQANTHIAQTLGVTEGAVRHHLRRQGCEDGRQGKPTKADAVASAIAAWVQERQPADQAGMRPINVRGLFDWLIEAHSYTGSYKSVLRHVRWHYAHNEALRRLGGVPAVLRIDNLKTGVSRGAGPWGEVNDAYSAYARAVGFHVDPCLPRSPEHKGKVESRIGKLQQRLDVQGRTFAGLADLQRWTDERLERNDRDRICPATGQSVEASWQAEQARLRPLPILPEVFDVAVTRPVHNDCTVHFEGRQYSVPFVLCGLAVEVRGGVGVVQILHDGRVVAEHRRGTAERIVLDPAHYEGPGDSRVSTPLPLGKLGRRLQEIALQPVQQRPLDLYAALAEVAR